MKLKIHDNRLQDYPLVPATIGSAGLDLRACIEDPIEIQQNAPPVVVSTGLSVAIPAGWVGLVFPRSSTGIQGLALKNTTGVIDSDYRGEILLFLTNTSLEPLQISPMDRIAQLVVVPFMDMCLIEVCRELPSSIREAKGFGSTGKK